MLQFDKGECWKEGIASLPLVTICALHSSSWNMYSQQLFLSKIIFWTICLCWKKSREKLENKNYHELWASIRLLGTWDASKMVTVHFLFWSYAWLLESCLLRGRRTFLGGVPILLHFCSALGYHYCGGRYCLMMTSALNCFQKSKKLCELILKSTNPDRQPLPSPKPLQHNFSIVK